jgi:hypothetical protein
MILVMPLLSANFQQSEFEMDAPLPLESVSPYSILCTTLLEPIRAQFNEPIHITSGYRTPEANADAHGVSNSQHMATADFCAADFQVGSDLFVDIRPVFDWIRNSHLVWDQLVLEHDPAGDVIHLSWAKFCRREALEGATHNETAYKPWEVAPLLA